MSSEAPINPEWINPKGFHPEILIGEYSSGIPFMRRQLYDVTLDVSAPLTLRLSSGGLVQSDRNVKRTDFSSVPRPLQWMPGLGSLSYPQASLLHDSAFLYHGLYFANPEGVFTFLPVTFDEANDILYQGIEASGGYIAAPVYRFAVSTSIGKGNWNRRYDTKLRIKYGFPS